MSILTTAVHGASLCRPTRRQCTTGPGSTTARAGTAVRTSPDAGAAGAACSGELPATAGCAVLALSSGGRDGAGAGSMNTSNTAVATAMPTNATLAFSEIVMATAPAAAAVEVEVVVAAIGAGPVAVS